MKISFLEVRTVRSVRLEDQADFSCSHSGLRLATSRGHVRADIVVVDLIALKRELDYPLGKGVGSHDVCAVCGVMRWTEKVSKYR